MCICIYVYVYVHIYIHIYMTPRIHLCIYICTCIYTYVCVTPISIHAHLYFYIQLHMYVPTIRLCLPFVLARRAEAILTASGALRACGRTSVAARGPRWSRPTHSPVLGRGPRASASERQARASTVLGGRTQYLCIQPLPLSLCQKCV